MFLFEVSTANVLFFSGKSPQSSVYVVKKIFYFHLTHFTLYFILVFQGFRKVERIYS